MTKHYAALAALAASAAAPAQSPGPDAAALFGAREVVQQASLSPDGKTVAFVAAGPGRTTMLLVGTPDTGLKAVLKSSGSPDHLRRCQWATDTRLVCDLFLLAIGSRGPESFSRIVSLNSDGSGLKMMSADRARDALETMYSGGSIIDWLGDGGAGEGGGKVLMTRTFVPEYSTGTRLANEKRGLGLERVDTTTLARVTVEQPNQSAVGYLTDGHGLVRIRGLRALDSAGYVGNTITYQYRSRDGREWKQLSQYAIPSRSGFQPRAVDRDLDVAYGFDRTDGRLALYKVKLDGSGARELVLSRPDVDVDALVRIGRQARVVGVSFATDKRRAQFFDPEIRALLDKLGRALPDRPIMDVVDASDDESKLLLWAGSDTDPGRYYLYDKATRRMGQLLDVRPGLTRLGLAAVRSVIYPAADGTPIPGYLTLPARGEGRNLPAIVLPHGGPGARDEWGFDWLAQYWANRGYAVLQPNFRGSSGYGDAWFQKNGFQSWRTAVGDVSDGARWLVKQGIARADKLAVFGWSYGGYAALQAAVVDPALFKAVVAVAPVTDLMELKREAQTFSNAAEIDALIGSGPHLREGSPAQNAKAIRVPVLLFHGDLDQNVAIEQSRLMAGKLRDAGAKPQFVEYKGLDHQLDDSTARADMLGKADAFLRAALGL